MAAEKISQLNIIKNALVSTSTPLVSSQKIEDAIVEIQSIKNKKDGYTAIGIKDENSIFTQWHISNFKLTEKISKLMDFKDVYISINSMLSPIRQIQNIRHLHSFWVDIDYYKIKKYKNKTTEEMISRMRKDGQFEEVEPSFFVDSGNGMYIFYLIESATKNALPIWQKIQDTLVKKFERYGADPLSSDAVHVLRLPGTINSKTGRKARLVYNANSKFKFEINKDESLKRYTIPELADIFLPKLPMEKNEWNEVRKKTKKANIISKKQKEISLYNLHTLHYSRMNDILALQRLRNGKCNGSRELMTFLYRYYSCLFIKDEKTALESTMDFNSQFENPLSESEVIKATKSAETAYIRWAKTFDQYIRLTDKPPMSKFFRENGCYVYSNKKLIKLLEISDEEMDSLKTIISIKEKNRRSKDYRNEWKKDKSKKDSRNSNGLTKRQQSKLENLTIILKLTKSGMKQKEIANLIKITQQGVSKLLKEWKTGQIDTLIIQEYLKQKNKTDNFASKKELWENIS
ncbi:hypothetical protein [Clostridium thermobutyricum]|uniref:hypothetical protein n=1 Tax=Clostridium thermobutyricum TaxID=29372 RepID=UPI0029432047|nr:hypothetical protein [Clostridium thermobutyricum]